MVNVEADFGKVEAEEIYFYRIVAEHMCDLRVFDSGVYCSEVLRGGFTTEDTESTEEVKKKANLV
jgi:hypothetical protein